MSEDQAEQAAAIEELEPVIDIEEGNENPGANAEEEGQEFEVVVEGAEPQPQKPSVAPWVKERLSKLSAQKREAREQTGQVQTELEREREKNKILEMALDQARNKKPGGAKPDPDDYDGGEFDPEFKKAQEAYNDIIIQQKVDARLNESVKQSESANTQAIKAGEMQTLQVKHYEKAAKLGVKDYEEAEDKVIEVLGQDAVNHMIGSFDDSHALLYYLGKNPAEAERIASVLKTNAIKGIAEITRLESKIKVKPKLKIIPDPDNPLEGGTTPTIGKRGPRGATFE